MSVQIGKISIIRNSDGTLMIGQSWNPQLLSINERLSTADELREIAAKIESDFFENDGEYQHYPAIAKRPPAVSDAPFFTGDYHNHDRPPGM